MRPAARRDFRANSVDGGGSDHAELWMARPNFTSQRLPSFPPATAEARAYIRGPVIGTPDNCMLEIRSSSIDSCPGERACRSTWTSARGGVSQNTQHDWPKQERIQKEAYMQHASQDTRLRAASASCEQLRAAIASCE